MVLLGDDHCIDYFSLDEAVDSLAHALRAAGLSARNQAGVLARPGCEYLMLVLALSRLGVTTALLDPSEDPARVREKVRHAEVDLLITFGLDAELLAEVACGDEEPYPLPHAPGFGLAVCETAGPVRPRRTGVILFGGHRDEVVHMPHPALLDEATCIARRLSLSEADVVPMPTPLSELGALALGAAALLVGGALSLAEPGAEDDLFEDRERLLSFG